MLIISDDGPSEAVAEIAFSMVYSTQKGEGRVSLMNRLSWDFHSWMRGITFAGKSLTNG